MEIVLVSFMLLAIVGVYYFNRKKAKLDQSRISKNIQISGGSVHIEGGSNNFEVTVQCDNEKFVYDVKEGIIVGVKIPGLDKYYEYMES